MARGTTQAQDNAMGVKTRSPRGSAQPDSSAPAAELLQAPAPAPAMGQAPPHPGGLLRVQLVTLDQGGNIAPLQSRNGGLITAPANGTSHAALTGLGADDHLQYAALAGRSTGQTLSGGRATGDLTLLGNALDSTKDYGRVLIRRLLMRELAAGGEADVGTYELYVGASTGIGTALRFYDSASGILRVALFSNVDPTTKQILMHNGTKWVPVTISGDVIVSANTGVLEVRKIYGKGVPAAPTNGLALVYDAGSGGYVTTVLLGAGGGTGLSSYASGDILYAGAADPASLSKLAANATASKKFLSMASSVPAWARLAAGDVDGVADASDGAAGTLGEAGKATGSGSSGSSGNWHGVTTLALTAGDWDVSGLVVFAAYGSSCGTCKAALNTTNNSSGGTVGDTEGWADLSNDSTKYPYNATVALPSCRINVNGATTVYLNYNMTFSGGTPTYAGRISARRVR